MSVEQPDVIDAIQLLDDGSRAVVAAAEGRPLRDDPQQLEQVREKIEAYLYALASGQVPEVAGRVVEVWLHVPNEPRTPGARLLVVDLHERVVAAGHGFTLVVQRPSDELAHLLGLTEEEHRAFDPDRDDDLPLPVLRQQSTAEEDAQVVAGLADTQRGGAAPPTDIGRPLSGG